MTNFKKVRESKGFSQGKLSKASGVKVRTIQAFDQIPGKIDNASFRIIAKLATTLNCKPEELFDSKECIELSKKMFQNT